MDCHEYTTDFPKHKKGSHLTQEERMAIRVLNALKYSVRSIARMLGCSPNTVRNELKRGTPPQKRKPDYSERRGEAVYKANKEACHRRRKLECGWVVQQVRKHKWSLDACCGYAKLHRLFEPSEMVCCRTLYNWVWANQLPLSETELPDALRRNTSLPSLNAMKTERPIGKSISILPAIAGLRIEEGHWEGVNRPSKNGQ